MRSSGALGFGVSGGTKENASEGRLAWMPCADEGFVTVKVLSVDLSNGSALVEIHPEGAASIAAAQAAADVIFRDALGGCVANESSPAAQEQPVRQGHTTLSHSTQLNRGTEDFETLVSSQRLLPQRTSEAPTGCADLLPGECAQLECTLKGPDEEEQGVRKVHDECPQAPCFHTGAASPSPAQKEAAACAAADDAVARVTTAFRKQLPLTVPIARLSPYTKPVMPPNPVPDDTANCGSLSAAALLQQLQHRYLRNEIYTYAAHVLLAVNPYKPLTHLYSAQQILSYKHWRKIARAYRQHIYCQDSRQILVSRSGSASTSDTVQSILRSLPEVLPLDGTPEAEGAGSGSVSGPAKKDFAFLHPCCATSDFEPLLPMEAASTGTAAAIIAEQIFKESAGRANRPPPHPFAIAEEALKRLVASEDASDLNDQEKARSHLRCAVPFNISEQRREMAALTGGLQTLREAAELRGRIVSCNAIFESFGNAVTRRNHNSSRIGRLTLLHFDGASEEECARFHLLRDAEAYRMLQPQESHTALQTKLSGDKLQGASLLDRGTEFQGIAQVAEAVDRENFMAMSQALLRADFSLGEIQELLQLLAGMLHLSNASFSEDSQGLSELQDAAALEALTLAALLLGVERDELKDLLRCRRVNLKEDVLFTWRNQQQSFSACCSLIKFIYNRIFDQIVQRLNEGFAKHMLPQQQHYQQGGQLQKSIGILDIYGFECFGLENGLEQLCINYANEKQQQLFVQRVIEEEIALYTREGVASSTMTAVHDCQKHQVERHGRPYAVRKELRDSFATNLKHSLFSSLPDTSALLRDLQEGVFRRLDDSCRLLAQGQQRDDLHFWKDLFAYCVSFKEECELARQNSREAYFSGAGGEQYLFFCLKGIYGAKAAKAAATGQLLKQLELEDLNSSGLVTAKQLSKLKPGGEATAQAAGKAAVGKVQERVFAVKHFAGTVIYGTDGWLELNNDRIEYELERLVAKSSKFLLRQAMEQHEARQQQEGIASATSGGGQFASITKRFVKSVKDLSQELQGPQMQLHFIRCFIPNRYMRPGNFDRRAVLQQLQHSGTLALVDILHSGFPHRMPLNSVAARLRQNLDPLVRLRLREQEKRLEQLMGSLELLRREATAPLMIEEELTKQTRILQTLRHCNPAKVRDQTLVSATLGLLPQCKPGSFICGVSLICFKAAAYGEASELITDPSYFFKTPEDLCRLVGAIQRMRWRVAARIVLHVHPTLLWLQRRAFLMRRIKEKAVAVAIRMLLLKKHILLPLKERVRSCLALKRGVRTVEQVLLRRGLLPLRKYRSEMAAADAISMAGRVEPDNQATKTSLERPTPQLDLSQLGAGAAETREEGTGASYQPFQENMFFDALLFPVQLAGVKMEPRCHRVALHLGKHLYLINFTDPSFHGEGQPTLKSSLDQTHLQVRPVSIACSAQQPKGFQDHELSVEQSVSGGDNTGPTPRNGSNFRSHLVTVAKHPFYNNLFLACNSSAELVLFDIFTSDDSLVNEEGDFAEYAQRLDWSSPAPARMPSVALPPLNTSPSSLFQNVEDHTGKMVACRDGGRFRSPTSMLRAPLLSNPLSGCDTPSGERSLPQFLQGSPIPPNRWLPPDLLQLVAVAGKQEQRPRRSRMPLSRPPTVRPLRVSFAHPSTADYALVLCLVQGGGEGGRNALEKLALVLVDLVAQCPAGWFPLSFPPDGLSTCAHHHSTHLRELSAHSASVNSHPKSDTSRNSGAGRYPSENATQLNPRTRSKMLSKIQLKPLWGNMWAVAGPALLVLFSVNLRSLLHPPQEVNSRGRSSGAPISLLWNLFSVPRLAGMSFDIATVWFTGCTYTRIPPPNLRRITRSHPLLQFLQLMPQGPAARSLDSRMQKLLLFSTADNELLVMQWSEKTTSIASDSGNLVLVEQLQLPHPILQFLRQEPEEGVVPLCASTSHINHPGSLLRALPWEANSLLLRLQCETPSAFEGAENGGCFDSDAGVTRHRNRMSFGGLRKTSIGKTKESPIGSVIGDFPSYGLAIVEGSAGGRVLRSLSKQALQSNGPDNNDSHGRLLAVTPLPTHGACHTASYVCALEIIVEHGGLLVTLSSRRELTLTELYNYYTGMTLLPWSRGH
ncbi:hypothetical protein Efla_002845 [Eimeria flavescens]